LDALKLRSVANVYARWADCGWTMPREPGETLGVIEDAPGSYVKAKG
jgi:hypothetical protein